MATDVTFAVEREFFGRQAALTPTFDPATLTGANAARFGQLRARCRANGSALVLPVPLGEEFETGETVTIGTAIERVTDAATDPQPDRVAAVVVGVSVAISILIAGVARLVRALM